jgi:hypothetical protein
MILLLLPSIDLFLAVEALLLLLIDLSAVDRYVFCCRGAAAVDQSLCC